MRFAFLCVVISVFQQGQNGAIVLASTTVQGELDDSEPPTLSSDAQPTVIATVASASVLLPSTESEKKSTGGPHVTVTTDPRVLVSTEPVLVSSPPVVFADEHRKLTHQTFVGLSIANEEKLFFENMHSAAQQLSLLGIKAVGLATQIQAIRGHIMMLQLIDEHIATLSRDHDRYTTLLAEAHEQLKHATGISR